MSQQWRATVTYATAPTPITDEQADALMAALPGYGIAVHDGQRFRLEMTVQASTLRRATDDALKAAHAAWASAFDVTGTPTAVHVLTDAEHLESLKHPGPIELVGIKEIGEMGAMSRQQAQQLTKRPDFPAPVAELGATKVYTKASVAEFFKAWPRKAGWAGRSAPTA